MINAAESLSRKHQRCASHDAEFFVADNDLHSTVSRFANEGLTAGEGVLLVTGREHWPAISARLKQGGSDVEANLSSGQLWFADVDDAVSAMLRDGRVTQTRFERVLQPQVNSLFERWPTVRVYGDAVAALARRDEYVAMQDLEECWNEFLREREIWLLCGYPLNVFDGPKGLEAVVTACDLHEHVRTSTQSAKAPLSESQQRTRALVAQIQARQRAEAMLAEAVSRERRLNRRKDEFLAMLAHELRNPMAPILSAVEVMKLRGETASSGEREIIERQVTHMKRLLDDLLDVSRVMFGRVEADMQPVDIGEPIMQAIEIAAPLIEERGHRLHVDVEPGLCANADEDRLAQATANILINAAKYTPEDGNIWINLHQEDGEAVLSVRDDGKGIEPELLDEIFDIFMQVEHRGGTTGGGLGLGLALVREIVQMHEGTINAFSEGLGSGSRFVIRLPLTDSPLERSDTTRTNHSDRQSVRRVLIVDDNVDYTDMLSQTLETQGHDVRAAHEGPSALALAGEFEPEVALLDLGLPGMSGFELAQRLRAQYSSAGREITLVAVTGYSDEERRLRSHESGFDAHLVKPVDLEGLFRLLQSCGASED